MPPTKESVASRRAVVTTLLDPRERPSVDRASDGCYRTIHRESLEDALGDLRERRATALLLSSSRYGTGEVPRLAAAVREFPQTRTVALLSSSDTDAARSVLALGQSGVRTLVDVRQSQGWRELRDVLRTEALGEIERLALARLATDLSHVSDDCWLFFETLVQSAARTGSVRALCQQLSVVPSTLMSRFLRLQLPTPKRYLSYLRLMRAARLLENRGLSIASVATTLDYSSPQSFGRHVQTVLQISASEFRRRYDGEGMLERLRTELILPHRVRLGQLRPLAPGQ
jgi:AraC-like DNA-binding protein